MRCNLCGQIFTASFPEEIGKTKYDETANAIIPLLKYGSGMPFYRQTHSAALMERLHDWLNRQFNEALVEPDSTRRGAIKYMLKHWSKLTRFLTVAGAPLDNNLCKRALKRAVLHRKNSLFYKTGHGAWIGDMFMSLIHTCHLMKVNAFDYLVVLQKHASRLFKEPARWMPWNFKDTIDDLATAESLLENFSD